MPSPDQDDDPRTEYIVSIQCTVREAGENHAHHNQTIELPVREWNMDDAVSDVQNMLVDLLARERGV